MKTLLETIAHTCHLEVRQIKGNKRRSRPVSYAKMISCLILYNRYRIRHRDIAGYLDCRRENVYYLIGSARKKLEYDKVFRELYKEIWIKVNKSGN